MIIISKNNICTLPPLPHLARNLPAKMVLQGEFGIVSASENPPRLKTGGFNTCIVLLLYDRHKKVGGLAHFDLKSKVSLSMKETILPEFAQRNCKNINAIILGGLPGTSDNLLRELKESLKVGKIKITGVDIFNRYGFPGLTFDIKTNKIYKGCIFDSSEIPLERFERMMAALVPSSKPHLIYKV